MSDQIFELEAAEFDLYVTRCVGPASEGKDRARWEIFVRDDDMRAGSIARLARGELRSLVDALEASLSK